ncbi:MAG: nucleoside hydrolase [Candidatus Acidiferrales bacterium]
MKSTRRAFLFWTGMGALGSWLRPLGGSAAPWFREADAGGVGSASSGATRRLIIDTDPGVDDAVSILLALKSPEVRVEALTVVGGNVEADYGVQNALGLLALARRENIPVALGAKKPLMRTPLTARIAHGSNGMGDVELPAAQKSIVNQHAVDFIIEAVKASPGELTILALGPLTNVALALLKDPSIGPQIAEVTFMGGTILSHGNVTPVATFNIYADPEAAQIVMKAGIPRITMAGTDVTTKVQFSAADFDRLERSGTPEGGLCAAVGRFRLKRFPSYLPEKEPTIGFNDLPATAVVIQRSLFTLEKMYVEVETKGELSTGMTVANRRNLRVKIGPEGDHLGLLGVEPLEPNVDVCTGIDEKGVKELFLGRISG